jgi:hypothetical protein
MAGALVFGDVELTSVNVRDEQDLLGRPSGQPLPQLALVELTVDDLKPVRRRGPGEVHNHTVALAQSRRQLDVEQSAQTRPSRVLVEQHRHLGTVKSQHLCHRGGV